MKWFLRTALVLACLSVLFGGAAVTVCALAAERSVMLPVPTGPFSVGRAAVFLKSERDRILLSPDPDFPRMAQTWIWYPVEHDTAARPCDYYPPPWRAALERKRGFFSRIADTDPAKIEDRAHCGAPLSPREAAYPLVFLRPGLKALAVQYSVLAEELASHGYIVVGFDAPYRSTVFVTPEGHAIAVAQANDADLVEEGPALERLATRLADAWASDTSWVLDELQKADLPDGLNGHIDWNEIGAAGHSLGGFTSAQFCLRDARCKAGVDIDGLVSGPLVESGLDKPFLIILSNHEGENDPADLKIKADLAAFYGHLPAATRRLIVLQNADHYEFSDALYTKNRALLAVLQAGGMTDGVKQLDATAKALAAFFDAYLKPGLQP